MAKSSRNIDMLNGPMFFKIIMFALPLALSSILQLLFNAADTIVVGQYAGSQALAAVGSNGALINLIVNAFMGLSIGANVIVARYRGKGDESGIHKAVHTSILVALICGCCLGVIGYFLAPQLLILMGTPEDVINLSSLYTKIYFMGMPFLMLYNFGAAILRSIGDTKRPLIYLTIAGVINVILNLFFVITFKMSVAGVALATVISHIISCVLVLRSLTKEEGSLKLEFNKLAIDKTILGEIVRVGLPAGLSGCVFSLSNVVIQSSINTFGSVVVAGNSAAGNIQGFLYVSMNSFHQSCVTFSSQNYGAKQYDRCDKALLISGTMAVVTGLSLSTLFIVFGEQLLSLYTNDPLVIKAGLLRMYWLFSFEALDGLMDILIAGMRGIGYSLLPTIVTVCGVCVFRLFWVYTVFAANSTIEVLYMAYPISWTITCIAHTTCYMIGRKKIRKKLLYA